MLGGTPSDIEQARNPGITSSAATDQADLVRIIKRKLKKIQYRPHLINGCLNATGLRIDR